MKRREADLPVVYLKAGEMHFADHPVLVVTVLGSCLSVTMFHRRLGLGGICHGLLPTCGERKACGNDCREAYKYVDCSLERMIRLFDDAGVRRGEIEVKCFGGADMFSRKIEKPGLVSVGGQNIAVAEKILRREGLVVAARDVRGLRGRKILFYTDTGEVLLKRLTRVNDPDIRW